MKKVLNKIGELFSGLFGILMAIFLGICFVILLPLDYIKYKRSSYYKKEHKKYKLFAATGIYFELYNEIIKNELPIKYISNPNNDSLECGWFIFDNTLIIPDAILEYNAECKEWFYHVCEGHDESVLPLGEYIDNEINDANELSGQAVCNNAIILIESNCIENADMAKNGNKFLIYNDNRAEVLKQFCANNL